MRTRNTVRKAIAAYNDIVVPASVVAQTWRRGGPRSAVIARLLDGLKVDALDEPRAKEIGLRLGDRDGADVVDAHVACCAVERRAAVVTSDPADIAALFSADEPQSLIPV